jgi:hypothetical protein
MFIVLAAQTFGLVQLTNLRKKKYKYIQLRTPIFSRHKSKCNCVNIYSVIAVSQLTFDFVRRPMKDGIKQDCQGNICPVVSTCRPSDTDSILSAILQPQPASDAAAVGGERSPVHFSSVEDRFHCCPLRVAIVALSARSRRKGLNAVAMFTMALIWTAHSFDLRAEHTPSTVLFQSTKRSAYVRVCECVLVSQVVCNSTEQIPTAGNELHSRLECRQSYAVRKLL